MCKDLSTSLEMTNTSLSVPIHRLITHFLSKFIAQKNTSAVYNSRGIIYFIHLSYRFVPAGKHNGKGGAHI